MNEYFSGIPSIKYEGPKSDNPLAFKFYNPDEIIDSKTMREHLRFAMSYWHTLDGENVDMFGDKTFDKSFGGTDPMDIFKHKAYAGFELMNKLDIDFWCFHDRDISPEASDINETFRRLDEMTKLLKELNEVNNKRVLWGTANNTGNPRYMAGAATSPKADAFAFAAAHVKKTMEITKELGGSGFVFWGGREGYDTLLNTDLGLEQDNYARLLRMAVDYKKAIGFDGDLYIEPKPKEPTKHQYDFDVATVIGFLRKYGLEKEFKMNVEANHATLAMHTFQHELAMARVNGMFGSIDANQGDLLLGWDTDQFATNIYDTSMCMLEVLRAGGFTKGGLNFDAKLRRASNDRDDLFHAFIGSMDAFALGLKIADKIIKDGKLDAFVADRYQSWRTGVGADIISGKADFVSLDKYAREMGMMSVASSKQEYLENLINSIMFTL